MVIDGSYNATSLEARSVERNTDFILFGREAATKAASVFDDYFARAKAAKLSFFDKLRGLPPAIIMRSFL